MFRLYENGNLKYYKIDSFLESTKHCFTTRFGGVSKDEFSSMNLRFNCTDSRENVLENFRIISSEISVNYKDLVLSNQVHEDKVISVGIKDRGNGIIYPNKFESADGLITAESGVPLATFYADCVPLFFLNPKERVIALSHSGWKGTVKNIAKSTIEAFSDGYGSKPRDILVAIGPSIGECCFRVGDDVAEIFNKEFGNIALEKYSDGWHVNLQRVIFNELLEAGVVKENITLADICTACNSDLLFSHRKTQGRRGNMAAIMELR